MTKTFLIIGASASGLGAASKLRDLDETATIICLSKEQEMPYNRCLIADYLAGTRTDAQVRTKDITFFAEKNISLRLGTEVAHIDAQAQTVSLANGETLSYDALFIGAGKSSAIPPVPGASVTGVFPFFDLDDAKKILAYAQTLQIKKVTVVGAGLTGLECADSLASLGMSVTIVERASQVLPSQIDQAGAAFLETLIAQHRIKLYKNKTIANITSEHGTVTGVQLDNELFIPAEMVVFATGGKTNTALGAQAGLATTPYGIVTNEQMQTSNEKIYAGGDIAIIKNLLTDKPMPSVLWSDAVMQGMVAAHNMVGVEKTYIGALMVTSSHIFGTTFVTAGPVTEQTNYQSLIKEDTDFYHRLLMHEGQLKGFVMVGNVSNVGQLRKALLEKTVIQPQHTAAPN